MAFNTAGTKQWKENIKSQGTLLLIYLKQKELMKAKRGK
jgi:hypothetical protein